MQDFQALHAAYLKSFQAYRDKIHQTEFPVSRNDPLIAEIRRDADALFSADILAKLYVLKANSKDPLLGKFVQSILAYLHCSHIDASSRIEVRIDDRYRYPKDGPYNASSGIEVRIDNRYLKDGPYNVTRWLFVRSLEEKKSQAEMRNQAIEELDRIVSLLQIQYHQVLNQHHSLKRKLLKIR